MNQECIQDFRKRRSAENFRRVTESEYLLVSQISFEEKTPSKRSWERNRQSAVKSTGSDLFSSCLVDGFGGTKKFTILSSSLETSSYDFWSEIWKSDCRVIARFDKDKLPRRHWLNSSRMDLSIGEFVIRKFIIVDKHYTQLELTVWNSAEKKTRKLSHFQYWDFPATTSPFNSVQLVLLKMINNKHKDAQSGKKPGLIVIHSVGCLERAVSICVLDICLEQLMRTNTVSIPQILLDVISQIFLESFRYKEYVFINLTLFNSVSIIEWNEDSRDIFDAATFRN